MYFLYISQPYRESEKGSVAKPVTGGERERRREWETDGCTCSRQMCTLIHHSSIPAHFQPFMPLLASNIGHRHAVTVIQRFGLNCESLIGWDEISHSFHVIVIQTTISRSKKKKKGRKLAKKNVCACIFKKSVWLSTYTDQLYTRISWSFINHHK